MKERNCWGSLVIITYHQYTREHIQNPMLPLATGQLPSKQMYIHPHCEITSRESTFTFHPQLLRAKSNQTPHFLTFEWSKVIRLERNDCKLPGNVVPLICAIAQLWRRRKKKPFLLSNRSFASVMCGADKWVFPWLLPIVSKYFLQSHSPGLLLFIMWELAFRTETLFPTFSSLHC